jgi:ribosomal protein S18 acetylase RimI-like enzyme
MDGWLAGWINESTTVAVFFAVAWLYCKFGWLCCVMLATFMVLFTSPCTMPRLLPDSNLSATHTHSPWKEVQIGYLKTLQAGDLKRRRQRYPRSNEMFLAYEVKPATGKDAMTKPLILNVNQIQNLPPSSSSKSNEPQEFVRGRILGFTEITQRPYGLGGVDDATPNRAVLTNLAVSPIARKSGIGSKLLKACEDHVVRKWDMKEIVLEVEDYNGNALEFYSKRGYQIMFSDPASRRFDVGGLFLRKVRCTREILRKPLVLQSAGQRAKEGEVGGGVQRNRSYDLFQRFRETVGVF